MTMSSAGFTPDDVPRAAGASVTSPQCDMLGAILLPRREACLQLLRSGWHTDVPMLHVDAPMGAQLKRVALLFASTVPSLRVLVGSDLSIPGINIKDASRAHEPSFMLASRWGKLLGFSVEPIMAGTALGGSILGYVIPVPNCNRLHCVRCQVLSGSATNSFTFQFFGTWLMHHWIVSQSFKGSTSHCWRQGLLCSRLVQWRAHQWSLVLWLHRRQLSPSL